ncbi:hypothetical protein Pint_15873 [Pistacia integerrima]|uniref:Uncharacterized protein n=2 Tax=Pistacia TaxID=55512 RepID=A0ACC1BYJ5_9ROSI|nr:hypothetical protein Pint_15873 [Pistacia integerrima]KAJ0104933.1 hypothetical protein Patl1_18490 [Pistacia atlantica]
MGLHMLALLKLNLLSASAPSSINPILTSLIWPFVLKLSFNLKPVRITYVDMLYACRLFLFQLGQIAFDTDQPPLGTRWERAIRLVCQRLTQARRSSPTQSDENHFHTLSVISL